tara:strand:+ start:1078 stop:2121 length:1044 start_codon:yes stop_codon:yes gene_type:complete
MNFIVRTFLYSLLALPLLGATGHAADAPAVDITENNGKELKFGVTIPNLKISNSIGLTVDDNAFNFFSHEDDGDVIIDEPSVSVSHEGKFDITFITGSQKENFDFQTSNEGNFDYLDLIPVSGVSSLGSIELPDRGLLTVVTESDLSVLTFNHLWDLSELNLNGNELLQQLDSQFETRLGFRSNISHYSSGWDYDAIGYANSSSSDSVSVFSVGPMLRLESDQGSLNENTDVYYKADISALLSKESMQAEQNFRGSINKYTADDDRVTVAGIINLAVGMNNQLESGAVISLSGSIDIRNDLPFISKPICTTGMDCNSAEYVAQAEAAHLDSRITVSPSVNLSFMYDF